MYICICKAITHKEVEDALGNGMSLVELKNSLGLGTDCGSCLDSWVESLQIKQAS